MSPITRRLEAATHQRGISLIEIMIALLIITFGLLGVAQMFDAAYGYDAVANPKPAPDAIHAFSDLTGLKPSEIAMVGDNRHDLEMAKAGGALAIAVLSGTGTRESLTPMADVVLDSIADLPAFLARD